MIHPTALVSAEADVDASVSVGPYAIVEAGTQIGAGCNLAAHAIVRRGSRIGKQVAIDSFAVVGGLPQDSRFDPELVSYVDVGDRCQIREGVTISRATKPDGSTRIGRDCMLMAASHVGHDCIVGDRVILANAALLAGHVEIGHDVFLGGGAAAHQFCRIGTGAIVGGHASLTLDVAPFTKCADRNALFGLNLIGLKRRKASSESIAALQRCYREAFLGAGAFRHRVTELLDAYSDGPLEARQFLEFLLSGKRGYARPGRGR